MKTLVIHPKDDSTDFLCPIYESIECKTILRCGLSKNEAAEQISVHDRIKNLIVGYNLKRVYKN